MLNVPAGQCNPLQVRSKCFVFRRWIMVAVFVRLIVTHNSTDKVHLAELRDPYEDSRQTAVVINKALLQIPTCCMLDSLRFKNQSLIKQAC